jgi:hypothetical protein
VWGVRLSFFVVPHEGSAKRESQPTPSLLIFSAVLASLSAWDAPQLSIKLNGKKRQIRAVSLIAEQFFLALVIVKSLGLVSPILVNENLEALSID